MVHSIHVPGHVGVGVASDGLSEVSTTEGDLINREPVSIAQKSDSHIPYLLLSYATIHGVQRTHVLTPVANMDCVHIQHRASVMDRNSLQ